MSRILKSIYDALNDPTFLTISQRLEGPNIYSILGRTHQEDWYSHFIAWVLNPDSAHGLGSYPLRRMLALARLTAERENKNVLCDIPPLNDVESLPIISSCFRPDPRKRDTNKEFRIYNEHREDDEEQKHGFLDIVATIGMGNDNKKEDVRVLLLCENKVQSKEVKIRGKWQTTVYADWAYGKFKSAKKCQNPHAIPRFPLNDNHPFETPNGGADLYRVLIFLSPKGDRARSEKYINITYMDVLRDVLIPAKSYPTITDRARQLITAFVEELERNSYATSQELLQLIGIWVHENEEGVRNLVEMMLYNEMWLDGYDTECNPRLNWLLCFADNDKWDRKVTLEGVVYDLAVKSVKDIHQESYWSVPPMRYKDGKKSQNQLYGVQKETKLGWMGSCVLLEDVWSRYVQDKALGKEMAVKCVGLAQNKLPTLQKIARHIRNADEYGSSDISFVERVFASCFIKRNNNGFEEMDAN